MARVTAAAPLTQIFLRSIKAPATGRVDCPDGATPGLCLRVTARDVRTWTLRMRDGAGNLRRITLGHVTGGQGFPWARKQGEAMRQDVRHNRRDPKLERAEAKKVAKERAERDRLTFGVLVGEWRQLKLRDRTPRYAAEAERALLYAFKLRWSRPAADLDRKTVARVLAACKPVMAGRTAAYGRACFHWATKRELLTSNPFIGHDVAAVGQRDRVLDDREIAEVWRASLTDTGLYGPIVRLLLLLLLTAQRKEEVAGMDWAELSPDLSTGTIPGKRTKNGKSSIVPMSGLAWAQLPTVRSSGLVFPGEGSRKDAKDPQPRFQAWSRAKTRLDNHVTEARATNSRKAGAGPKLFPSWVLHDLRRTCATGLQRLGIRSEVTAAVLNHLSGARAGIQGIYQRHDWAIEKRIALAEWAERIQQITSGRGESGNEADMTQTACLRK